MKRLSLTQKASHVSAVKISELTSSLVDENGELPLYGEFIVSHQTTLAQRGYDLNDELILASYFLRNIHIDPRGYGECTHCYSTLLTYGITNKQRNVDDSGNVTLHNQRQSLCADHVLDYLKSTSEFNKLYVGFVYPSVTEFRKKLEALEPLNPNVDTSPRDKCDKCNEFILLECDSGRFSEHSFKVKSNPVFIEFVNDDNEPKTFKAHAKCVVKCHLCDQEGFVYGWSSRFRNASRIMLHPIRSTVFHEFICGNCVENSDWWHCEYCGLHVQGEDFYSEVRDMTMCDICYDSEFECSNCGSPRWESHHTCHSDDIIHDYSYKPDPRFYGVADYHFGIELEVEVDEDEDRYVIAEDVTDFFGDRVYVKDDGSLDNGFEIVTHPHSFQEFSRLDLSILRRLARKGCRSWDTMSCGLHVHISRTAFKDKDHELKFQKLIYDNQRMVEAIAGRSSEYARFNDKGKLVPKIKHPSDLLQRYEAVNSIPDHTLEIRVFRGSLNERRVRSAVEFLRAGIEYTRDLKIKPSDNPLSWYRFMAHVLDNNKTYPNFTKVAMDSLQRLTLPNRMALDNEGDN